MAQQKVFGNYNLWTNVSCSAFHICYQKQQLEKSHAMEKSQKLFTLPFLLNKYTVPLPLNKIW